MRWNCEVEVFGTKIQPGQLIHADKHGFLVVPKEDEQRLLEASVFMDNNECNNVIWPSRSAQGKSMEEILQSLQQGGCGFRAATSEKFGGKGEW